MADSIVLENNIKYPAWIPTPEEQKAQRHVFQQLVKGRNIQERSYNQLNGRTLCECIDDWTKRWNGYIPPGNPLLDTYQSRIFLNFTRNAIIGYLSNTALNLPKTKIKAVNKKTGLESLRFAQSLKDLIRYSNDEEDAESRFFESSLEVVTKGTVIRYEGYNKNIQTVDVPEYFDAQSGTLKYKKEKRILADNCFQEICPIEDFYIGNAYQPDIQKQPFLIWRKVTTHPEGSLEFGHYKNWKYVQPGGWGYSVGPTTFYRNALLTDLAKDQVEILRYYNRSKNKHIIIINGIVLYNGPIPFKDGMYPFAKAIFEPFANDFFWGMAYPQKIMGEQDLLNTNFNAMTDKNIASLLPYGLSSDLDDLIEDDILVPNKIRKVGDINKWKFDTLPGVQAGEMQMLLQTQAFAQQNSSYNIGQNVSPSGKKIPDKQQMFQQQESMKKLGFPMSFMENFERDRTKLRLNHILQFYSIPKIQKVTGKDSNFWTQFIYRDIKLTNSDLSEGKKGNRVIKLIGDEYKDPNEMAKIQEELTKIEMNGEMSGVPTEALAISVDVFYDYNCEIQVVKESSYEKNQIMDQIQRQNFATWRLSLAQMAPVNVPELIKYVEEAYDIDTERFEPKNQPGPMGMQPGQPQPGQDPSKPKIQNDSPTKSQLALT